MSLLRYDKAFHLSEDTKCLECGLISISLMPLQKGGEPDTAVWKVRMPFLTKGNDCNEARYSLSWFFSWSCSGFLPDQVQIAFCSFWSTICYNQRDTQMIFQRVRLPFKNIGSMSAPMPHIAPAFPGPFTYNKDGWEGYRWFLAVAQLRKDDVQLAPDVKRRPAHDTTSSKP